MRTRVKVKGLEITGTRYLLICVFFFLSVSRTAWTAIFTAFKDDDSSFDCV